MSSMLLPQAFAQSVPSAGSPCIPSCTSFGSLLKCTFTVRPWESRTTLSKIIMPLHHFIPQSCFFFFLFTICTYALTCSPPHPMCTYQALTSYRAYLVSPPPSNTAKLCLARAFGLFCYCFVLSVSHNTGHKIGTQ